MRKTIILDAGSGETNTNIDDAENLIRQIARCYTNANVILKYQLFTNESVQALKPLDKMFFARAYGYAQGFGLECTASVFDIESLNFLSIFKPRSMKIACRNWCYPLIDSIPTSTELFVSVPDWTTAVRLKEKYPDHNLRFMCCVAEYPAIAEQYYSNFGAELHEGISDHVPNSPLYKQYSPNVYECHVTLLHGDKPDSGPYSSTVEELKARSVL